MEEGAEGGEEGQAGSPDAALTDLDLTPSRHDVTPSDNSRQPEGDERTGRTRWAASSPYLIVAAFAVWLSRPFWWPGGYVVGFDTYAYSGPNLEVTERAIRHWRLPILNDLIFGGVPHVGNPSAAALYPPQLLTLILETNRAMGVLVAAHMVLLGVGMVLLARRLGVSDLGAGVAGGALVASGATLTKTVQYEQILVIAWVPLLLASIHSVLHARRPWKAMAATSAVTAAVLLAGHPQFVYQTVVFAIAATIGFAIGGERWRRIPHLAAGAMLGGLIALPQLVAVIYATADSALDGGRTRDELLVAGLSLQPRAAARALFGTVQDVDPAFFVGSFESIGSIGVVVAIVALIGWSDAVADRERRPWTLSFGALGVLSLVWALGPRTFVFHAAFAVLPGFDLARGSARWLVVVVIVAALFAGVGVDALVQRSRSIHLAVASVTVAFVALAFGANRLDADRRTLTIWAVFALVAIGIVAVVALSGSSRWRGWGVAALVGIASVELVAMSLHSIPLALVTDRPFTDHDSAAVTYLQGQAGSTIAFTDDGVGADYEIPGFRPNANVLAGVPSMDGYDGGVQITERWATALQRFTPDPPTKLPLRNSLQLPVTPESMARLGVRYIMLDKARPAADFIPGWVGPVAEDKRVGIWENPAWLGDAVAWPTAVVVRDAVDAATRLRTEGDALDGIALVDGLDTDLTCDDPSVPGCEPVGLDVESGRPERLIVRTDLDRPSVVSVARQALPGWRVEIDGQPAQERVVDGLVLGVEVPGGQHTVTWRYESPWLMPSIVVSLLAVAATIALALADMLRRRA